jgi:hypothetical protein
MITILILALLTIVLVLILWLELIWSDSKERATTVSNTLNRKYHPNGAYDETVD